MRTERPRRPLDGYTAVDRAGTVASAVCTRLLADFGARVVNLEGPEGHPTRRLPPHAEGPPPEESSLLHALLSPHKESVLTTADRAQRLIAEADILFDSPESMDQGPEPEETALRVVLSWFGLDGPDATKPATDQTLSCEIGLVKAIGRPEGPPLLPAGHPLQVIGGMTAFAATLGPLIAEVSQGRRAGGRIDVSLLEAAMCLTEVAPVAFFNGGQPVPRLGVNRFVPTFPGGIFAARDGHVGITALTPAQWKSLCRLVGHPEFGEDPRLQTSLGRLLAADEIVTWLEPALRTRSAEEWFHTGQAERIPVALVPTMREILESDQLKALDGLRTIHSAALGTLRVPRAPFRLHGAPARREGPVAALGQSRNAKGAKPPSPHAAPPARPPLHAAPPARPPLHAAPPAHPPLHPPHARPSWLRGLRILDLTMGWAGPLAARHLADQGAEVIKIESTRHFDWWRGWDITPAALAKQIHEKSPAFNTVNRNKWGLSLDLEQARGAELLFDLVACADVVVENYSAGVMQKLGLDYPALQRRNPRLVMLSMPPFGGGGPLHAYRGYGSTVEQSSGLPHLNGTPSDPPTMLHVALGDPVAGITAAGALLLAVLHQQRTGEGQLVDLSQVEATSALGLHGLAETLLEREPTRLGNRHPVSVPHGLYRCVGKDQWVAIAVESDRQWARLCTCIGDPALERDAYATAEARRAAQDLIDERLTAWTSSRDRDHVAHTLCKAGIPAAGVYDVDEVLTHPRLLARDFWQWIERDVVGTQPHPVAPYRSGTTPHGIDAPAPTLGEHSRAILGHLLGLDANHLDELERDGIIGTTPQLAPLTAET